MKEVMVCGHDCHPGDANCNNYCNYDTTKRMADSPPDATSVVLTEDALSDESDTLRRIADIAHHGGLIGFSDIHAAMAEIRKLSQKWWDKDKIKPLQQC